MTPLIIHSNFLNSDGTPGPEYAQRLSHGANMLQQQKVDSILLTGGKATKWVDISHVESAQMYLTNHGVDTSKLHKETLGALETVGELVFARLQFWESLLCDTSVIHLSGLYHIPRMKAISDLVWWGRQDISFEGISTNGTWEPRSLEAEQQSLQAFYNTFEGVAGWDIKAIEEALWKKHGLYKKHPQNPYRDTL